MVEILLPSSALRAPSPVSGEGIKSISTTPPFGHPSSGGEFKTSSYKIDFESALNDDLNTPQAIAVLFEIAHELNKLPAEHADKRQALLQTLTTLANTLGILQIDPTAFLQGDQDIASKANALMDQRKAARASKNWAESDRLRAELEALGLIVEDLPQGSVWRKA